MKNKALLDTNILIYAHDSASPFFEKSYSFLKKQVILEKICVSNQNFIEAYRIWTQKLKKPITAQQAITILDYYYKIGLNLIYPTQKSFIYLKQLISRYSIVGVHIFDTQLVATMMEYNINKLYTVNTKDFEIFREIQVVNPLN